MGHIRLGNLPRTRKWQQVVALIEGGAGTAHALEARRGKVINFAKTRE